MRIDLDPWNNDMSLGNWDVYFWHHVWILYVLKGVGKRRLWNARSERSIS